LNDYRLHESCQHRTAWRNAQWYFYKTNPISLVHGALSRFENLPHVSSRRPLNHHIEGRWQRDWLSATSGLQALQLVESLQ
jgi:hypothetical protein